MLKKLLKKVSGVVMAVSIFSLIGCSEMDQQQAADVEKLLQEKYDKEFTATHIGGRYGTSNNDTVTTYVHPADQENLVFKAVADKDGKLVSDTYIPRVISNSINEILKQELANAGVESETFTFAMNADSSSETNPDISLEEYVTAYKPGYFSAHMIVKETPDLSAEKFEKALSAVYQAGLNTTFQVAIRVISEDEYEKCLEEFKQLPEVSKTWFTDYNVVDELKLIIDANGFQVFESSLTASNEDGE